MVITANFGNPSAGKPRGNCRKLYSQNANIGNIQDLF